MKYAFPEQSYNWIATIHLDLKQYDEAIAVLNSAVKVKPDYANTYSNVGKAWYNKRHYPKAIEAYRKAIELKASDPEYSYAWIGDAYQADGDPSGGAFRLGGRRAGHVLGPALRHRDPAGDVEDDPEAAGEGEGDEREAEQDRIDPEVRAETGSDAGTGRVRREADEPARRRGSRRGRPGRPVVGGGGVGRGGPFVIGVHGAMMTPAASRHHRGSP